MRMSQRSGNGLKKAVAALWLVLVVTLFGCGGEEVSDPEATVAGEPEESVVEGVADVVAKTADHGDPSHRTDCHGRPRFASGSTMPPMVLERVEPDYSDCDVVPAEGLTVEVDVSKTGSVTRARMPRTTSPCVDAAVLAAVYDWTFCPGERDGHVVDFAFFLSVDPLPTAGQSVAE